jgi:hypothetical protein
MLEVESEEAMEITLTAEEQKQEQLSQAHLTQAVQAIQNEGFVVLNHAVRPEHLEQLLERMTADSLQLLEAERWGGAGRVKGHLQQGAPPFAPYVFRDIVANPFAIQVTSSILGKGAFNRFYNGNTNCPGSQKQPLHRDNSPLWLNLPVAHPPCGLIVNIALIDVDEELGSTELWPGTHLETTIDRLIDAEIEAKRRTTVPPIRANTKKGSLLIRDERLWHRGMPNLSNTIRHMLAQIHTKSWLQRPYRLLFNTGCEEAFAESDFDHNVHFTAEALEYLSHHPAVPRSQLSS